MQILHAVHVYIDLLRDAVYTFFRASIRVYDNSFEPSNYENKWTRKERFDLMWFHLSLGWPIAH